MKGPSQPESLDDGGRDALVVLQHRRARRWRRLTSWLRHICSINAPVLAYVVPVVIASLAVQTWFKPGTVIATGDIGPPVVQGPSYLSNWNQVTNGVGAPSYDIVLLPYSEFLRAARALGLDASISQRIWLTALVAGSAAAVVFFARSLALSPLAAGLAGLFATFNVFRVIVSFDSVPLAALILCAVLGGLVVRAGLLRDPRSGLLAFALTSSVSGFVFVNPPHFVLLVAWILVSTLLAWARGGRKSLRSSISFLLRVSPLVVLANCWWIVPVALTVSSQGFAERVAAPGPFAWAWTDRRASVLNAITLNTTWGWNEPMYFPYAARMNRLPLSPLRFALPLLAFSGVVFSRRRDRRFALMLLVVCLAAVLVAKGFHPPLATLNRWLYIHVPGSRLFREPSKVLLFLMLVYAVLAGLGAAALLSRRGRLRIPAMVTVITLSIGALAYVYPLFTGEVVPDKRPVLPAEHVVVPDAWTAAPRFLDSLPDEGKTLVLPNADFYEMPTSWGYYGVPFTNWAIGRPVLEPLPGAPFQLQPNAEQLVTTIQGDLLGGRSKEARLDLDALGVRYILLRRDLDTSFRGRQFANPDRLARELEDLVGVHLLRSFGLLDVYALNTDQSPEVFSAAPLESGGKPALIPRALALLPHGSSLIMPKPIPHETGPEALWSPGGRVRILRTGTTALWEVNTAKSSHSVSLRLSDPTTEKLGEQTIEALPSRMLRFPKARGPALISLNGATFAVDAPGGRWVRAGYATLPEKVSVGLRILRNVQPIDVTSAGPVGDCNNQDDHNREELALSASILKLDGIPTLRLSARDHAACVAFPVKQFGPRASYRLQFDYRRIAGSTPRVCLWQEVAEHCAALPELDDLPGWHHFDATVPSSPRAKGLRLFFYAFGTGNSMTTIDYRRPRIEVFEQHSTQRLNLQPSSIVGEADLPKGWVRPKSESPLSDPEPIDVSSHSPVGDCNKYDSRSPQEVGISASTPEVDGIPTLQLSAREHAACVSFAIKPFEPAARYRVRFDYRGLSGVPPRVCLWREGAGHCAPLPELDSSPGWHHFDAMAGHDPQAIGLQLFFYADGQGDSITSITKTQYRNVSVTVDDSEDLFLVQDSQRTNVPTVDSEKVSPAEFQVSVSGADDPYVLVLTESYASGWRIQVDGTDINVPHVVVNGYANGWILDRQGDYVIRLTYEPESFARVARWTSLISIFAVVAYGISMRLRRGRKRRTAHT
jgi:arabinofuranan 3-O-arabinosyltransferase